MKNSTKKIITFVIYLLAIVVLSVITFLAIDIKGTSMILAYCFTLFGLTMTLICTLYNYKSIDSYMLKLPTILYSYIYSIVCYIVGLANAIITLKISKVADFISIIKNNAVIQFFINQNVLISIYVVLTVIFFIFLLFELLINKGIISKENEFFESKDKMNYLLEEIELLKVDVSDKETISEIEKLEEKIKYSPLYGNKAVQTIENEIKESIYDLKNSNEMIADIEKIIQLVDKRNIVLKRKN